MNATKNIVSLFCFLLFSLILTACSGFNDSKEKIILPGDEDIITPRSRYNNIFNENQIPGQWTGYGIGDPYVLRHNGVYYLYASTKNYKVGVRAWESTDLMNWTKVTGEGLEEGYVSDDPITSTAYAPEVIYWNGTFYMYTSPGGKGHYILTSDSPKGPFVAATVNFGQSIDGSVFIDDDEKMYFTRSSTQGIRMHTMDNPLTVGYGVTLESTSLGNWTEGPTVIKVNDIYYITYTGTHITSPGYRVNYSYATDHIGDREAFKLGANHSTLLNTDPDFKGLGHNSLVMGPDMDSYHIVYHNLLSAAGPNRGFNINRVVFNGSRMTTLGPTKTGAQVPKLPDFSADNVSDANFSANNGLILTKSDTDKNYTAEFNFSGSEDIKFISSYKDDKNYLYVTVSYTEHTIKLIEVSNGNKITKGEGTLVNDFSVNDLHTVRISVRDNNVDVFFDNLTKINDATVSHAGGKIGYLTTDLEAQLFYTAFSNVAQGLSDQEEAKIVDGTIESNLFLPDDGHSFGVGSGLNKLVANDNDIYSRYYENANALKLVNKGDYATYLIDIMEEGYHGLDLYFSKSSSNRKIGIQIDEASVMVATIPEVQSGESFIKSLVTEFYLPKGIHSIRLINIGEDFEFVSFDLVRTYNQTPRFDDSLREHLTNNVSYITDWETKDGGHFAPGGNKQVLYIGDNRYTDFNLEVSFKFIGDTNFNTAGILFRSEHMAISSREGNESVQGYYVGFNNSKIFLHKYDYNLTEYNVAFNTSKKLESDKFYALKLVVSGNKVLVYIDNELLFTYVDSYAYSSGKIALNTEGAATVFKDLSIYE